MRRQSGCRTLRAIRCGYVNVQGLRNNRNRNYPYQAPAKRRGKAETVALLRMIGALVLDAASVGGLNASENLVITRAGQLFEEETGRPWDAAFLKATGTMQSLSPGEDEKAAYIDRARRELDAIEEEGLVMRHYMAGIAGPSIRVR